MSTVSTGTANNAPDTAAVRELLGMMSTTLATLGKTFDTLTEQSTRVATLGPQLDSAHQIHQLRRQMRAQEKKQDIRINEVKTMVKDELKVQVAELLRAQIAEAVRDEIKKQVSDEVQEQLKLRVPVPIEEQAAESTQQLKDVRTSLINSESRRANAILRASNLDDQLAVILKSTGEPSKYFPSDLKTLFGYDNETAKILVQDYELPASESREKNLNKFMAHTGVQFHLIPVPILADP
ncbi:hypothetical protein M407DRAFT_240891 [Tulasnella calospora MUT 4182]|uniref:Uncharacterized protein n=1 Tax=Tulasnella calospora MUT 4182 TaxID=1051891 RepID=A0A0C3LJ48_9AGAM|nr:hypothetical protein M407DRAFT_240891 [Tulasnella calospora MUT 4182]